MREKQQEPVSIDDVKAALAALGVEADQTNAQAVRKITGKGSAGTIQRHLDEIRAGKKAALALEFGGPPPTAPKDLMAAFGNSLDALWAHAWVTAQAQTAGALAKSQQQEQLLAQDLAVARADTAAALEDAAISAEALADVQELRAQALAAHEAAAVAAAAQAAMEREKAAAEIGTLRLELQGALHEKALLEAKQTAAVEALRGEVDRLVSQLADLRAALGNRAAA